MTESQAHGKSWEDDIKSYIFWLTKEECDSIPHTARHDIPGELNRLDKGTNISIKTTGSDTVCMADVSRVCENVGNGEQIHAIILMYKQNNSKKTKKLYRIIEFNLTNSRELLFGTATIEEINELVTYVKSIPKDVTAAHRATYKRMAKDISAKNGGYISYAPKVDSKGQRRQRRVQCCIPKFSKFVKEHPERVIAESQSGEFRGGTITEEIVSPPRQRNKKAVSIENVILPTPSESGSELH